MNKLLFTLLLLNFCNLLHAQYCLFNQYNASLANISPAFIANIDVNQISYTLRNQWPGYHLGYTAQQFSCSRKIEKINSGFGILYNRNFSHRKFYQFQDLRLQYAYRVHFTNKFILNTGFELAYQLKELDTLNYTSKYDPLVQNFTTSVSQIKNEGIGSSAGIILQRNTNKFYIGMNWSTTNMYKISQNNMPTANTFSFFGNKRFDFSSITLYTFGQYSIQNNTYLDNKNKNSTANILFAQTNLINQNLFVFGIGYKYIVNNYGNLHFRIGKTILLSRTSNLTIGYSFDAKPFIRDNNLKCFSSHEFYLKFKSK